MFFFQSEISVYIKRRDENKTKFDQLLRKIITFQKLVGFLKTDFRIWKDQREKGLSYTRHYVMILPFY